ncbi:DNase I-like protein, partial [Auricularia subglabra TFB-10046 SS5]
LIPGRALLVTLEWHGGRSITVLAIYAPTEPGENNAMWETLRREVRRARNDFPRPDILLGDFNFVEDPIDRFPAHLSRMDGPTNFDRLKRSLKVIDGWRNAHPGSIDYTWRNPARSAMSRIDRIYASQDLVLASRKWGFQMSELTADDHSRVLAEFSSSAAPKVGEGRWTMQPHLMSDKAFMKAANAAGLEMQAELDEIRRLGRTQARNPQGSWTTFKSAVVAVAKKRMKEIAC